MSDTPNSPQEPVQPTPEPTPPAAASSPPAGPSGTPPAAVTPDYQAPAPGMGDPADVEKHKVFAMLSYVGILWLVPLLAAKESPFAKYHCNQGIVLSIGEFAAGILLMIVWIVSMFIPLVGWCLGCVAWLAFLAAVLTLSIMGVINALNGKLKPLPLFPVVTWVK
jgi:uncharacterized membrane protein